MKVSYKTFNVQMSKEELYIFAYLFVRLLEMTFK